MSVEQIATSLPIVGGKAAPQHPLGPLTAFEITESSRLIKSLWPADTKLQFKSITLQEPSKAELSPYLVAEHSGKSTPTIDRRSFVVYYIRNTVRTIENLTEPQLEFVFPNARTSLLTFVEGQTPRSNHKFECW